MSDLKEMALNMLEDAVKKAVDEKFEAALEAGAEKLKEKLVKLPLAQDVIDLLVAEFKDDAKQALLKLADKIDGQVG